MSWQDSGYWEFWIYRLFVGYAPDGEKEDFYQAWSEADGGSLFWCGQVVGKLFSVGWAMPDRVATTEMIDASDQPQQTQR